tara:strand:+ start:184 stop:429 length:246 start_codon:yes stop_codon:yes gene_type:complete
MSPRWNTTNRATIIGIRQTACLIIYGDSLSESHQKITANTEKFLDNQSWHDLITGSVLSPDTQMEMMATYPTVWISNTGIR